MNKLLIIILPLVSACSIVSENQKNNDRVHDSNTVIIENAKESFKDRKLAQSITQSSKNSDLFLECSDPSSGLIVRRLTPGYLSQAGMKDLDPKCLPDTLYRWTSQEGLEKIIKLFNSQKAGVPIPQDREPVIYTWRSPIGTFAYGNINIRFKLKKNVKFYLTFGRGVTCSETLRSAEETENTVIVFIDGMKYIEYDLCSLGPVESISWDLPQNLNEMNAELNYVDKNGPWLSCYFQGTGSGEERENFCRTEQLFRDKNAIGGGIDHKAWHREFLSESLEGIKSRVAAGKGGIIAWDESKKKDHFTTEKPIFRFWQ